MGGAPPPPRTLHRRGPKIAILGALRCRVRGGWGGSAHYPDPTAQSAYARGRRLAGARTGPAHGFVGVRRRRRAASGGARRRSAALGGVRRRRSSSALVVVARRRRPRSGVPWGAGVPTSGAARGAGKTPPLPRSVLRTPGRGTILVPVEGGLRGRPPSVRARGSVARPSPLRLFSTHSAAVSRLSLGLIALVRRLSWLDTVRRSLQLPPSPVGRGRGLRANLARRCSGRGPPRSSLSPSEPARSGRGCPPPTADLLRGLASIDAESRGYAPDWVTQPRVVRRSERYREWCCAGGARKCPEKVVSFCPDWESY